MKKTFAIIALLITVISPVLAGGMGEVYAGAATGAVTGALGMSWLGPAGWVLGAIAGTIVGAVGGSVLTESQIQEEEKNEEAQNIGVIEDLENVTIPGIEGDISDNYKVLERWQSIYDTNVATATMEREDNLNYYKQIWGMKNAELSSQNREGETARLLSKKNKDRVIALAGEDLELNTDEAVKAAQDVYNDPNNFENGQLTEEGAKKLNLVGGKYGIYEQELFDLSAGLLEGKTDTELTLEANKKALERSKNKVTTLKERNQAIQKRRWW